MLRVGGIMDLLRVWGRRRGRPAGGALDEILKGDKALGGKVLLIRFWIFDDDDEGQFLFCGYE